METLTKRAPGRPREFNREDALQAAMLVFWRHGYEGASLTDLTEAMGISRPTLYAAFGDKITLFREAALAYTRRSEAQLNAILALPTAREVAAGWLHLAAHLPAEPSTPTGCMILHGALTGSADTTELRQELTALRHLAGEALAARLHRAHAEGDLPPAANPQLLADYLSTVATGLTVATVDSAPPQRLEQIIQTALTAWPA